MASFSRTSTAALWCDSPITCTSRGAVASLRRRFCALPGATDDTPGLTAAAGGRTTVPGSMVAARSGSTPACIHIDPTGQQGRDPSTWTALIPSLTDCTLMVVVRRERGAAAAAGILSIGRRGLALAPTTS
jgi:hypothetical protein